MNKPAPKEPSMDEILSSIRQIIADDDATLPSNRPALASAAQPAANRPFPVPPPPASLVQRPAFTEPTEPPGPLALSAEQIVESSLPSSANAPEPPMAQPPVSQPQFAETRAQQFADEPAVLDDQGPVGEAQLVDPEDVTFDIEEEDEEPVAPPPPRPMFSAAPRPTPAFPPPSFTPEPPAPRPAPAPRATVAQAAPMPDPTLSRDIAEQLLEPTTGAVVKSSLNRLSSLSTIGSSVTIEAMIREMLRPMLKEWLDENLPVVVERMVEKEIARISRGGQ